MSLQSNRKVLVLNSIQVKNMPVDRYASGVIVDNKGRSVVAERKKEKKIKKTKSNLWKHPSSQEDSVFKHRLIQRVQGRAAGKVGVTANTYYRWRKDYGGMGMDQARRLKDLEAENVRLKRAVADLTLDNQILKEVSTGKF